jgi:hypothetical protein
LAASRVLAHRQAAADTWPRFLDRHLAGLRTARPAGHPAQMGG